MDTHRIQNFSQGDKLHNIKYLVSEVEILDIKSTDPNCPARTVTCDKWGLMGDFTNCCKTHQNCRSVAFRKQNQQANKRKRVNNVNGESDCNEEHSFVTDDSKAEMVSLSLNGVHKGRG